MFFIETKRIGLRKFTASDLDAFAALNSDPKVMQFFPSPLTKEQSVALIDRINKHIDDNGFGLWAAELRATNEMMGFVGMQVVPYETDFTPAVEIGWRLARKFWGKGYASEASIACLQYAFNKLNLDKVVSFTALSNQKSYAVMERIGMKKSGEFDHPKIKKGHPLERHVLYEISKQEFQSTQFTDNLPTTF